jgi:hypothetical protein
MLHGMERAEFLGTKLTASSEWGIWSHTKDCIPFLYHKPEGGSRILGEHWLLDDYGMYNVRWLEGGYDEEEMELEDGTTAHVYTYPVDLLPIGHKGIDFPPQEGSISWPLK